MCLIRNNRQRSTKGNDLYIGFSIVIVMNKQTTIALFAIVITAFGIIAATSIIGSENTFAQKDCPQHGCKGDKGYYTTSGHHHCFDGSSGCKRSY
jgi:hypothetical protein